MIVEKYERKVIELLCGEAMSRSSLYEAINKPDEISCKFTGAGYYLELNHNELPENRIVCDKPQVVGLYQEQQVGFIVFIENNQLMLECYCFGNESVNPSIRDGAVHISTT